MFRFIKYVIEFDVLAGSNNNLDFIYLCHMSANKEYYACFSQKY